MNKVVFIVDSSADITEDLSKDIIRVPLCIRFNDKEYLDGVSITNEEFYSMLESSEELPTTSQASPPDFKRIYKEITNNGDKAVVITLSSEFSGTYQSATIAREGYEENIFIVDSLTVACGMGILVNYACKLREQNKSAKEISEELDIIKHKIKLVAVVDTLEYLKKGGRISKAVAFAGSMLSIKPIIGINAGPIKMLAKARGLKQAGVAIIEEIKKYGIDFEMPVQIGYTGNDKGQMVTFMEDNKEFFNSCTENVKTKIICSVIGTHVGPGAVAVAFYSK